MARRRDAAAAATAAPPRRSPARGPRRVLHLKQPRLCTLSPRPLDPEINARLAPMAITARQPIRRLRNTRPKLAKEVGKRRFAEPPWAHGSGRPAFPLLRLLEVEVLLGEGVLVFIASVEYS